MPALAKHDDSETTRAGEKGNYQQVDGKSQRAPTPRQRKPPM